MNEEIRAATVTEIHEHCIGLLLKIRSLGLKKVAAGLNIMLKNYIRTKSVR